MSMQSIATGIKVEAKSIEALTLEKYNAAKKALEELAVHVLQNGVTVADDTEAVATMFKSALEREIAALNVKLSPPQ